MTELEHKLKTYYENNRDYEPPVFAEDYTRRLMAAAAPAPIRHRRRFIPVAALILLAFGLGAGLLWLRSSRPVNAPEPAPAVLAEQEAPAAREPVSPPPAERTDPAPAGQMTPLPDEPAAHSDPAPADPENTPIRKATATTAAEPEPVAPAEQEAPQSASPAEQEAPNEPEIREIPEPQLPDEPQPLEDPASPADDEPDPWSTDFDAIYRMDGDRETLTMTLLATGESIEVDITGWQEELSATPEEGAGAPPTYIGRNSIVDFIFEKNVTYYLTLDEEGAVQIDLDVADPKEGENGERREP